MASTAPSEIPSPDRSLSTSLKTHFTIGTRKSALALHQTSLTHNALLAVFPSFHFDIRPMSTIADKNQVTALYAFNAKSIWTQEFEDLLLSHSLDLVVHSLKDVPTQLPLGCTLGAAFGRKERRDCVVMSQRCAAEGKRTLADLKVGDVVGTSSVRRAAQLRRKWPGLEIRDVRGNIGTRLAKLDAEAEGGGKPFSALILAAAGVQRVGLGDRVTCLLSRKEGGWLGAVGQGALGVETRDGDQEVGPLMEGLMRAEGADGKRCMLECLAERSLLRTLEGGCSVPVGVETEWVSGEHEGEDTIQGEEKDFLIMHAIVVSVDGQQAVEGSRRQKIRTAEEADLYGFQMARDLVEKGAGKILEEITLNRAIIAKSGGA